MFYAHIVLAKKGPLARIWLAAHWDKKLTKAHVFETNIEQSVEGIMEPKVKLALRTSGHLLLGVVRIYSRKAKYLLADCNEAFVKIKMAFRPGMVDLPEEHREAAVNAITLPEVFHDFDTALPELNDVDIEAQFSINQSRADEITMREDYGTLPMNIDDDGFGDMGFDTNDTPDLVRDNIEGNMEDDLFTDTIGAPHEIDIDQSKEPLPGTSRSALALDHRAHIVDDGFGDEFGQPAAGLFEGDIFAEAPAPPTETTIPEPEKGDDSDDDLMNDHYDMGAPSPAPSTASHEGEPQSPSALMPPPTVPTDLPDLATSSLSQQPEKSPHHFPDLEDGEPPPLRLPGQPEPELGLDAHEPEDLLQHAEQTTLLNNEEESFALAPVDASALKGVTKAKRKRKLIVDEVKNISGEEMKSQLANTLDIVTTLDLAPPTKRLMYWKETGGVEKLFALPARDLPARCMSKIFQRHLHSRQANVEDFSMLGPMEVLALEQPQQQETVDGSPVGKKSRKRKQGQENIPPQEVVAPLQLEQPEPYCPVDQTLPPSHDFAPPETPGGLRFGDEHQPDISQYSEPEPIRSAEAMHQMIGGQTPHMEMPATPGYGQYSAASPMHSMMGMPPPTPGHLDEMPNLSMMAHGGAFTPGGLDHGGITPHHTLEHMDSIPNLPADQVSSILDGPDMNTNVYANMGFDAAGAEPASPMPAPDMLHHDDQDHHSHGQLGMSERIANEWTEDYEFPPSVGQTGEEQGVDETIEQFEERVLNKRAAQMFLSVRTRLHKKDSIFLSEMTYRNSKKQAAQKFYSLLVLKKFQALEIAQDEPYGDILVTKGVMFENPTL